jgi:hypothetical protein
MTYLSTAKSITGFLRTSYSLIIYLITSPENVYSIPAFSFTTVDLLCNVLYLLNI